jgi:quercetin dioxygenase-like cupin family protein
MLRRFLFAERDVLCSKQMPCGKNEKGINDTHSLRVIPALSGDAGVTKYEIPVLKESHSYTFTKFAAGTKVARHTHDEGQLRIITSGSFNFIVNEEKFEKLEEADWIYIPKDTEYSIETLQPGAIITGYGMSCKCSSDRNIKSDFTDVDEQEILSKVSKLQIESWKYTDRDKGIRHIGPMAQEFKSLFNVGGSDKVIDMVDANGIVLAAIKALNTKLLEKDSQIEELKTQIAELRNTRN